MTIAELKDIALHAAKGTIPANFTAQGENANDYDVNAAFVDGLNELAGSVNQFMKNRYDIYEIVVETVDKIMPKNVIAALSPFAEVQVVEQGKKAIFKQKVGKMRAKKFLTQVGLSGVYETFRLDSKTFELAAHAVGGGATIDFERMLDGAESLAEVMEVITTGLTDAVFVEVSKAMRAAYDVADVPAANRKTSDTFEADKMVALMNVVRAYGNPVIFAPQNLSLIWARMLLFLLVLMVLVLLQALFLVFILPMILKPSIRLVISIFSVAHLLFKFLSLSLMKTMPKPMLILS